MTDRELLELLIQKVEKIESNMATMASKDDIASLNDKIDKLASSGQQDVMAMLQVMDKKLTTIQETQVVQGESINILAMRQLQTDAEVAALKKAK